MNGGKTVILKGETAIIGFMSTLIYGQFNF